LQSSSRHRHGEPQQRIHRFGHVLCSYTSEWSDIRLRESNSYGMSTIHWKDRRWV